MFGSEGAVDLPGLIFQLGIGLTLGLTLWWAVLTPRKDKNGQQKSSLLVPGWKVDQDRNEQRTELERTRKFYSDALKDEQERNVQRVGEWRTLRDEAIAAKKDADEDSRRLLVALTDLGRDVSLLLEIHRLAARDGSKSGTARDA